MEYFIFDGKVEQFSSVFGGKMGCMEN